jgi:predicted acyl esterase
MNIIISRQIHFVIMLHLSLLLSLQVSVFTVNACADYHAPYSILKWVPVTVDGNNIHLRMRIYKPAKDGKFPTLVLNHGSTGSGIDSTRFRRSVDMPDVALFFAQRGWAVVIPARRGRGGSDGLVRR